MHLKTLTLRGFKSFATATTLSFEPGINCVVGPNGSGKSNVVDALSWVMGEQGAKNLRGGAMADVIFAGTAKRQPLGRAEVSLTIDNTDGALPIDYSEVTISRTLFRAGGSEYAINGTACRLLDIQELLSDTGMGREMHVIIGQGRLDAVLSATPEDRRIFIEEAAGVLKHRRRKEKALRKLDTMENNLTRVEDLAAELRRQLGPLARQAETARRAQVIQSDAFDARARLLADDIAQAQARLQAGRGDEEKVAAQRAEVQGKVAAQRAAVAELEQDAAVASPQLAKLTMQWQQVSALAERFRSLAQLAAERERSLRQDPGAPTGEDPAHIRERAAQARNTEAELRSQVEAAEDALRAVIQQRELAEAAEREKEEALAAINRTLADRRESAALLSGQIQTANSRIEALTEELARIDQALQSANARMEQSAAQVTKLEQDAVAHTDGDDTLSIAHEEAARELQEAKDAVETARTALSDARSAAVQWRTKAQTLALSLAPQDATAWFAELPGARGLVRDQLQILPGWESAAEAALAGVVSGAVVESVAGAVDALRAAREADAGRLELLIAGEYADQVDTAQIIAAAQLDDSQAVPAASAITGSDDITGAVRALVANTILCADLASARKLLTAGAVRVATLAGDVLTAYQATGGEVDPQALLSQQASYSEAVAKAESAAASEEQAQADLANATARANAAAEEFESLAGQLNARDSQLAAVSAQLGVLRQGVSAAREEIERNETRRQQVAADLQRRQAELERLNERSADLDAEPADLIAKAGVAAAEKAAAHAATIAQRSAETEARLKLRTREERLRALAGKADALENQARSQEQRLARLQRAAARRAVGADLAGKISAAAISCATAGSQILAEITQDRETAEASRAARDSELSAARQQLDDLRTRAQEMDELSHRQELALAEQRIRYEQLTAHALDDLGMDANTLVNEFGPHLPITDSEGSEKPFVREEQEKRLAKAERGLARLGKINPLALEEHAALEERQRYLTEQIQDIRNSRQDLHRIVRDIDERVEEVLTTAFADVAVEFTQIFSRLFPGGTGKLVLTDPDNILTTGVDIEARPPGKRVKRLSLLSGGERSLTALAFLIAIFKACPSPFYVMDEVEAALDDTNLSRLLEVFEELQENSQLLVITHQKRTMEIADTIYGMSMAEDGVTSVISQRIREVLPE
ncbi:MAG: chromosome segregation protein SMC [Trueperella sp.]|nr:chromosome segregation protein SMC [Trueperella sp.]